MNTFKKAPVIESNTVRTTSDLKVAIDQLVSVWRAENPYIKYELDIPENISIILPTELLHEIFSEMNTNALIQGFVNQDKADISILVTSDEAQTNMSFMDNAETVSQDTIDRIFDPFYGSKADQTGLGLHMVYNIITTQHAGQIQCESELGSCTRFTIRLPHVATLNSQKPIELNMPLV